MTMQAPGATPATVKQSFEVYPISNSGKRCGPAVYVRARNQACAEAAGKHWMRTLGRYARHVRAEIYRPELDLEIRGYVQRNPVPSSPTREA
jgi:hypothetical protein